MSTIATGTVQLSPYLAFDGNCAEVVKFYEKTLDAKIIVMMTIGDSPMAEHVPPADHGRVLNAQLQLPGGAVFMAGDARTDLPYDGIRGVTLSLSYQTVAEGERVFNALSEGGSITMAWSDTFWAKKFGMCTDKYGVEWIINGELLNLG
jgi:PhnB protein